MSLRNTESSWGSVTKFMHWSISSSVIMIFLIAFFLLGRRNSPYIADYFTLHESLGMTVLFLMIIRLPWRLSNKTPALPSTVPTWQRIASRTSHALLYLCLFIMPLSGWIHATAHGYAPKVWWLYTLAAPVAEDKALSHNTELVHNFFAWVFGIVICIHVLAAIKHHFIDKDNVLSRMLPSR